MRAPKIAWLFAGAVLGILACLGVFLLMRSVPAREVKQADGTVIRLEKVSFGKREPFTPGNLLQRVKQKLAEHLPPKWANRLVKPSTRKTSWNSNFYPAHTNEPALQVWITRIDPVNGSYQNVDVRYAEIEDEDGCILAATTGGGEDNGLLAPLPVTATPGRRGGGYSGPGPAPALPPSAFGPATVPPGSSAVPPGGSTVPPGAPRLMPAPGVPVGVRLSGVAGTVATGPRSSITWFTFEVFPRRDKQFKVRFLDSRRQILAEFTVDNPAPPPPPVNWAANNLPVTVTNGGVAFTLTELTIRTNTSMIVRTANALPQSIAQQREMLFNFDTLEPGGISQDWDPVAMELWDSSGNHAVKRVGYPFPLCPQDPVWKMEVKFVGREGSVAASNSTWTISNLDVPRMGQSLRIETNIMLGGVPIKVIGLGGAGKFVYTDGALSSATVLDGSMPSTSLSSSSRPGMSSYTLSGHTPHLALAIGELTDDQRVSVSVTDNSGREIYARDYPNSGSGPLRRSNTGRSAGEISYIGPSARTTLRGAAISQRNPVMFVLLEGVLDARWSGSPINVTICVHTTHTVDFTFKPPGQAVGK